MPDAADILAKVQAKVKNKKAKAKPLPEEPTGTKSKMLDGKMAAALKESFGSNFSQVKIHTGGNAGELAKGLKAQAFAIGYDVYFGKPAGANDLSLVAHELTHIAQFGGGKIKPAQKGKALVSK